MFSNCTADSPRVNATNGFRSNGTMATLDASLVDPKRTKDRTEVINASTKSKLSNPISDISMANTISTGSIPQFFSDIKGDDVGDRVIGAPVGK